MNDDAAAKEVKADEEVIDDWNLASFDFHVFAQHEKQKIYSQHLRQAADENDTNSSDATCYMFVECVEALTPVDMVNLGSGVHDATGNCVWTGAFMFIDALQLLAAYFYGKRVVELGCGTGIAGIALLCSRSSMPSFVALTDADPNALELCHRNCRHNGLEESSYDVRELTWGESIGIGEPSSPWQRFDTVLATDVLYDIGVLPSLFHTAADLLTGKVSSFRENCGIFILCHVPRACYSSDQPPVENLEDYIVQRASEFGFQLKRYIRPLDLGEENRPEHALNNVTIHEMDQIGAGIFVFSLEV